MLARANWARWQVQFMARHPSSTIDGYIDQAWEDVTAHWAKDLTHGPGAEGLPRGSVMNFSIDELKKMVKDTMGKNGDARIDALRAEMDTLQAKSIAGLPPPGGWRSGEGHHGGRGDAESHKVREKP